MEKNWLELTNMEKMINCNKDISVAQNVNYFAMHYENALVKQSCLSPKNTFHKMKNLEKTDLY